MENDKKYMATKIKNTQALQETIDLEGLHQEIINQYKSVYAFCQHYRIDQSNINKILKRRIPATLRALSTYCQLLDLDISISFQPRNPTKK